MTPTVGALNLYPVKSCRGIALERALLTERGIAHDREWMIVEGGDDPAPFVTQREIPRLALVETRIEGDALMLSAPGMSPLAVAADAIDDSRRACRAVVWRDTVAAIDQGDAAARWLAAYTGHDLRLVRFDLATKRLCNPQYAGDGGAHTGFADGYPLLVIGSESLADLNRRLAGRGVAPLPMNRFRPNVVLDGLEAYDEDHLSTITIGEAVLRMVKPCTRCQITTTDQATAEVGVEPLSILAGYRNHPRLGGVAFGMNAIVVRGAGSAIDVGSPAVVDWAF